MERMPIWHIALRRLEMPFPRYLTFYVGGAALAGFLSAFLLIFGTGGFNDGALFSGLAGITLIVSLPLILAAATTAYPLLEVQRVANRIEKEMHMFITRMGILSLGEVGAQSMFLSLIHI